MPDENKREWPEADLRFVEHELAKEYANICRTRIRMVIGFTQTLVPPQTGRVKLLAEARKNPSR